MRSWLHHQKGENVAEQAQTVINCPLLLSKRGAAWESKGFESILTSHISLYNGVGT
jgi:hypothetical protein